MRGINPQPLKILDGCRTKKIVPNACHHEHFRSAKSCCHGLVRAFAPETQVKLAAKNCLARLGESVRERSEINVGAAYNRNPGTFGHGFSGRLNSRRSEQTRWIRKG